MLYRLCIQLTSIASRFTGATGTKTQDRTDTFATALVVMLAVLLPVILIAG